MTQNKQQQRKEALASRDEMSQDVRDRASHILITHADLLMEFAPIAKTISGFWPIRSEIDPRPLMQALAQRGVTLALPALVKWGEDRQMIFRAFEPNQELVAQGFDTFGPGEKATTVEPDMVLLPLAAFDAKGNRLGYGGGFYDRTLAKMQERGLTPRLVGLAFACQEVDTIAVEPHDIRLEAILTESGLRRFDLQT